MRKCGMRCEVEVAEMDRLASHHWFYVALCLNSISSLIHLS